MTKDAAAQGFTNKDFAAVLEELRKKHGDVVETVQNPDYEFGAYECTYFGSNSEDAPNAMVRRNPAMMDMRYGNEIVGHADFDVYKWKTLDEELRTVRHKRFSNAGLEIKVTELDRGVDQVSIHSPEHKMTLSFERDRLELSQIKIDGKPLDTVTNKYVESDTFELIKAGKYTEEALVKAIFDRDEGYYMNYLEKEQEPQAINDRLGDLKAALEKFKALGRAHG